MDSLKLVIEMLPDGRVNVNGPIGNKTLCYGMLEAAKDAIRDYVAKNASPIVHAPAEALKGLNGA